MVNRSATEGGPRPTLTTVGVTLTPTDTDTGQQRVYTNSLGDPFAPIQDTDAFALCE